MKIHYWPSNNSINTMTSSGSLATHFSVIDGFFGVSCAVLCAVTRALDKAGASAQQNYDAASYVIFASADVHQQHIQLNGRNDFGLTTSHGAPPLKVWFEGIAISQLAGVRGRCADFSPHWAAFASGVILDIFELDRSLIERYAKFARSFSSIHAPEIQEQIDSAYDLHRFWPPALITINPRYEDGASIDRLVSDKILDPDLRRIFALGDPREPIRLHRHQERAIAKAQRGESFIVTTGTGSGKSLCFFVPIIDAVVRAYRAEIPDARCAFRMGWNGPN